MKRKHQSLIMGIVLLASAAGAVAWYSSQPEGGDDGGLLVVVTVAPQVEFAGEVGGDLVRVTAMVPPGRDPHTYEPTPSQMRDVADADVYFMVGSGIEFEEAWMDTIMEQNDDMLVVDGSRGVQLRAPDGDPVGRRADEHDHDGDEADPHIWMSLRNAVTMVENLRDGLMSEDPGNAEAYSDNADAYMAGLRGLDDNVTDSLSAFSGSSFLVYHPAFSYFAHDYGLNQIAVEDEGKEPGSAGLAAVMDQAKDLDIHVVFVSPQFDEASARTIADEIDGEVITLNPLAGEYMENMGDVAGKLADALDEGGD